MSDKMNVLPFNLLLNWMLTELEASRSIFGIHRSLFYSPSPADPYAIPDLFGQYLATPIGPGAGPHTQLAQNILCAWLSGARFVELKTVQIMDELEIPRPCIDMEDEGYNVEWSQELKLEQSASEYIKAWVLVHLLHRHLGFAGPVGTIFNMSVGYNLEGIQSPPMTCFMDRLQDASEEIAAIQMALGEDFPHFADVVVPSRIVNNVTLSTMHGCPPDEIERIARYLLEERGLHTFVKLNPTLLGREMLMRILHDQLGFREITIPDRVFEHDLQYGRAVELIKALKEVARARGLTFGVKLSNTLALANHKGVLPGDEMYMSGRALYPITINLFHRLSQEFEGDLDVSFSAGADALNVTAILAAGARPVTAVSDILKPGGYSRLLQHLENLGQSMRARGATSLEELSRDRLANLEREAAQALNDPRYKKDYHPYGLPKVESRLGLFDCITAPCVEQCAVRQDVPEYVGLIARGEYARALEVILSRNPLPGVTGYVCTHLCQARCTRNNYDEPVAIRALKRFAAEKGEGNKPACHSERRFRGRVRPIPFGMTRERGEGSPERGEESPAPHRVAVIGSGPSGLAAAYFLALNGIAVTIYEAGDRVGGMLALAPTFRLPAGIVRQDIERIERLGVTIERCHPITAPPERLLDEGFDAVYVASGAQKGVALGIEGEDGMDVYQALDLLERAARGERIDLGERVLVIGGGNSAMDAARTAARLAVALVCVVYRRTRREMPATEEEIEGLFAEGVRLEELASPTRILVQDGRVVALECIRNELGPVDADGRRRPVPIPGSQFRLEADSIIIAIGQRPDVSFLRSLAQPLLPDRQPLPPERQPLPPERQPLPPERQIRQESEPREICVREDGTIAIDVETGQTSVACIYAGGDAVRGPATIIEACADGRRAAEAICRRLGVAFTQPAVRLPVLSDEEIVQAKRVRARKEAQHRAELLSPAQRGGFDLIEATLTEEDAQAEAARCVQCSSVCDKCVEVCPNRANYAFIVSPISLGLPQLSCRAGTLMASGEERFCIEQARQIIHVEDWCNECGNCATFCVHHGKPYLDKPRLFLQESDFERETDNAFYVAKSTAAWTIRRREGGREARLELVHGTGRMEYEDEFLRVSLLPDFQIEGLELKAEFEGVFSLATAAEMAVILRGLVASLPFLPYYPV